jgi:hypothetical protein
MGKLATGGMNVKVAASLVIAGLVAAGVVEWQAWPREAGVFAAVAGALLGGLVAFQANLTRRLDAMDGRTKNGGRD